MVRFVMTRCSASEFCSQALTFLGKRRLLVTTVHLGACRKLAAQEHQNGLGGGSPQNEQSEEFQAKAKASLTESKGISDVWLVISSLHLASLPFSAHPNLPGLVDPPRHAQETPHLLEGNGCVPAANGM